MKDCTLEFSQVTRYPLEILSFDEAEWIKTKLNGEI
jgi:hypothetical protein